jgi:hypothetical protein
MTVMDDDVQPVTAMEPIPVHLSDVDLALIRGSAEFTPVFGAWQTLQFQGVAAETQVPQPLFPADLKRRRGWIQVNYSLPNPQQIEGSITSPGANANVASLGSGVPAGWYTAKWSVDLDGTPGAGDVNNFKLTAPNVATGGTISLTSENNGAVGHYAQDDVEIYVGANNATVIAVKTIAAGTAGAIYSAQLVLIPIAPGNGYVVVGTLNQVGNGTSPGGGRIYAGQRWEIKGHTGLYVIGDGATALNVVTLTERDQGD